MSGGLIDLTPQGFHPHHHCGRCAEAGKLTELTHPGPDWCEWCRTSEPDRYARQIVARRPGSAADAQTVDAMQHLERQADAFVTWPYKAMRDLPPLPRGSVNILAAVTGGGKTAVTTSMIHRWVTMGVRCYVLPLEIRAHEWRVRFACHVAGVHPDDALSGRLRLRELAGDDEAKQARLRIKQTLEWMRTDDEMLSNLYIAPERVINTRALTKAFQHAASLGFTMVVVDHIDHVGDDEDGRAEANAIAESKRVLYQAHTLAQDLDVIALLTSQLNEKIYAGDKLSRYKPAQLNHLLLHTYKTQVSTQILSTFRPLDPNLRPDDMKDVMSGKLDPTLALVKGRAGLASIKQRHDGSMEGNRFILSYDAGRIRDRTDFELEQDNIAGVR